MSVERCSLVLVLALAAATALWGRSHLAAAVTDVAPLRFGETFTIQSDVMRETRCINV